MRTVRFADLYSDTAWRLEHLLQDFLLLQGEFESATCDTILEVWIISSAHGLGSTALMWASINLLKSFHYQCTLQRTHGQGEHSWAQAYQRLRKIYPALLEPGVKGTAQILCRDDPIESADLDSHPRVIIQIQKVGATLNENQMVFREMNLSMMTLPWLLKFVADHYGHEVITRPEVLFKTLEIINEVCYPCDLSQAFREANTTLSKKSRIVAVKEFLLACQRVQTQRLNLLKQQRRDLYDDHHLNTD